MSFSTKLALIKEMLDNAESSLRSAKQLLNESLGTKSSPDYFEATEDLPSLVSSTEGKIIEGVFDGEGMVGKDKNIYPVPANYASKSKLVAGDVLKLTIGQDGRFLYKQIGPVERKTLIGTLIREEGKFKVLAGGRSYKALLASITYNHGEVGDRVTIITPANEESEWAAVDAIIPQAEIKLEKEALLEEETPKKITKKTTTKKKNKVDELLEDLGTGEKSDRVIKL